MKFTLARAPVTATLIVLIAIVFGLEIKNAAFGNDDVIWRMGANYHGMLTDGQYWRIIASMFLHANALHVLVNLWSLYQLGMLYEFMFGSTRFTLIYFVSGAVAAIASSTRLPPGIPSVGASGAIFGILGAFIFSIRRSPQWRNESWTRGLLSQLTFWALLNIALGFTVPRIDNVAHIAGLATGLALGFLPHRVPPPPPSRSVIDVQPYDDGLPPPQHQP